MVGGGAKGPGFQACVAKVLDEDAWWTVPIFLSHVQINQFTEDRMISNFNILID
jgi:hypothetical protein